MSNVRHHMESPGITTIYAAGNTSAPALGVLRSLGFVVSREADGLYKATRHDCILGAEDPLALPGLAKLHEARGASWQPSDAEVEEFLSMEYPSDQGI